MDDYGDNQGGVGSASWRCGYALILVRGERTGLDPIWRHPASTFDLASGRGPRCLEPAFIDVDGPPNPVYRPPSPDSPCAISDSLSRHTNAAQYSTHTGCPATADTRLTPLSEYRELHSTSAPALASTGRTADTSRSDCCREDSGVQIGFG